MLKTFNDLIIRLCLRKIKRGRTADPFQAAERRGTLSGGGRIRRPSSARNTKKDERSLSTIAISLRSMSNVLDSSGRMSFGQFVGVQENKENTDGCGIEGYGVSGVKKLSPHITEKCNIGNGFFFKKAL